MAKQALRDKKIVVLEGITSTVQLGDKLNKPFQVRVPNQYEWMTGENPKMPTVRLCRPPLVTVAHVFDAHCPTWSCEHSRTACISNA